MIVLNLGCGAQHRFEGWFASAEAFEAQLAAGEVNCPVCGACEIVRLPSAPYVQRGAEALPAPAAATAPAGGEGAQRAAAQAAHAAIMALARKLAGSAENVGERFVEEARRIHYGEAEARAIRGKATLRETGELLEEGIAVLPLPLDDEPVH